MTFEEFYRKVAVTKYYKQPSYPRMDNWAIDLYETPTGFIAGMSDAGYCRWVGYIQKGVVKWKVTENYPRPLNFVGITEEEFNNIKLG